MLQFLLEGEATTNGGGAGWGTWIGLILLVFVFYFIVIRPSRKQEKEAAQMRDSLELGDEITTIGGIIGEIVAMKGETITVETSKNGTRIRFLKSAVRSVDLSAAEKRAPAPAPEATEERPALKEEPSKKPKKEKKAKNEPAASEQSTEDNQ